MRKHGWNEYKRGCRCEICRQANTDYARVNRERKRLGPIPDDRHGRAETYRAYGCRCDLCREAEREKKRATRAAHRSLDPQQPVSFDWQTSAACKDMPLEWFFADGPGFSTKPGREMCQTCPVQSECLNYALADPQLFGIWGGTDERERAKIRARRYREQRKVAG